MTRPSFIPHRQTLLLLLLFLHISVATLAASPELPLSAVVLVTPTLALHPAWFGLANVSAYLSPLGQRQAYLIGRELRRIYVEQQRLLPALGPAPEDIEVVSWADPVAVQTAHSIMRGLLVPGSGPVISDPRLRVRAVPPVPGFNFSVWTSDIREAALPHYVFPWPVRAPVAEPDLLFSPDRACENVGRDAYLFGKHDGCVRSPATQVACKDLYGVCKFEQENDNNTCRCLEMVREAQTHLMEFGKSVSNKSMVTVQTRVCDEYWKEVLHESGDSDESKLVSEKLFADITRRLESAKQKLTIYIISEMQMRALVFSLSEKYPTAAPSHGSTMWIEQFPTLGTDRTIRVLFNKSPVNISGATRISMEGFRRWVAARRLADYAHTCGINPKKTAESFGWIIYLTIGVVLGIALVGFLVVVVRKHWVHPGADQNHHPEEEPKEADEKLMIVPAADVDDNDNENDEKKKHEASVNEPKLVEEEKEGPQRKGNESVATTMKINDSNAAIKSDLSSGSGSHLSGEASLHLSQIESEAGAQKATSGEPKQEKKT